MKGYMGKILFVNLTSGQIEERIIPDRVYEMLLSGVGLGAYVLYSEIPAGADPLGPENILGFTSGLLTGTGSLMTGRWMVVCKSPLTGGWGDANCGGTLAPAIKQCGYDGIFFSGIAEKPVYLHINNKGPQLKDASHVWGKDATESEEILRAENTVKKKPSVAVIGTAGEKVSLIAGVCNDGGRIAARSGGGAVMGSKRLKAIVLAGSKPIKCHDLQEVKKISQAYADKIRKQNLPGIVKGSLLPLMGKAMTSIKRVAPLDGMMFALMMRKWGTPMSNGMAVTNGDTPIKNWAGSVKDYNRSYYSKINADYVIKREYRKYHCYSCVVGCGGVCDISDIGQGRFTHTHKPEYETCAVFGGLLMNRDLDSIFYINELLNRAGMDSISAGHAVAFAMECYEKGLLTPEDTGGLKLTWGNAQAVVKLIEMMIAREGLGDILADGVKIAAGKIGSGAEEYAIHAGGQEPGMHDSRFDPQMGVHYSTDPTPGRHTIGAAQYYNMTRLWEKVSWAPAVKIYPKDEEYIATDREALKTVAGACYKQIVDGIGGCLFAQIMGVQHWQAFEWLNAATGWGKTPDEYMLIGKRMQTLRQLFNVKHGIEPKSFKIHPRMAGDPPLKEGPNKGRTVPIDDMMSLHWKHFGWDENTGIPLPETIQHLELNQLLQEG